MLLLVQLFFLAFFCVHLGNGADLPPPDDVDFVFFGLRHGARNPGRYMPGDKTWKEWGWEGKNQLVNTGKRQAYAAGKFVRDRYGGKLLPDEYHPQDIKVLTASPDRCHQTVQICLAGLYPPTGRAVWNQGLPLFTAAYEVDDSVLHLRSLRCPYYAEVYKGYKDSTDPGAVEWLGRDPELVKYISEHSGWPATLNDLADVADNIGSMLLENATLPEWVTKPTLKGYPPKDMVDGIRTYRWGPRMLCMNNSECVRVTSGHYLYHFLDVLRQVVNGTKDFKDKKLMLYSSNLETTSCLIKLLKVDDFAPAPTTAGYLVEYSAKKGLRFFYIASDTHTPDSPMVSLKRFSFCKGSDWCPVNDVIENTKANSFENWKATCKLSACSTGDKKEEAAKKKEGANKEEEEEQETSD